MPRRLFFACVLVLGAAAPLRHARAQALLAKPAVVQLLEDDVASLLKQLNNDGGLDSTQLFHDFRDFFAGVASVRVTPFQRFSARLNGWNYPIVEKPGAGEYRYVCFAWKRIGGTGIMVQFHGANGSWNQRYYAGQVSPATAGWGTMLKVADKNPDDWQLVTRDLFKDFGAFTITGFALTPMDGGTSGFFDHFYLGRSIEDLDRMTQAMFGRPAMKELPAADRLNELWEELASADVPRAAKAVNLLLAGNKVSVPYIKKKLQALAAPASASDKRIQELISTLDDEDFQTREKVRRAGADRPAGAKLLLKAHQESTSLEARRRLSAILKQLGLAGDDLAPDQLRLVRVIRVLEWSATTEARQALEALARLALGAGLNVDVRRALQRMRP